MSRTPGILFKAKRGDFTLNSGTGEGDGRDVDEGVSGGEIEFGGFELS